MVVVAAALGEVVKLCSQMVVEGAEACLPMVVEVAAVDTNSYTQAEFFQNSMEACTPPPHRSWSSETR